MDIKYIFTPINDIMNTNKKDSEALDNLLKNVISKYGTVVPYIEPINPFITDITDHKITYTEDEKIKNEIIDEASHSECEELRKKLADAEQELTTYGPIISAVKNLMVDVELAAKNNSELELEKIRTALKDLAG